ncbi:ABC transporter ATP-binding protein [Bombilactobacillus apium]|uniref:ABC transporter ATP-binding protein n=1 Tax=Bombilactobacillus apium TaxID=2675299 RepID=UPI001E2AB18B|nr:ATP-binding cassette domain-containing protein [Bombilactobacillus apium]
MTPILEVRQITKTYGTLTVVQEISFTVAAGQTIAILGPDGAGKSTTLKMIYAATKISSDRSLIKQLDVSQNPRAAKWQLGVVMQDDFLDTTLTVEENLIAHGILFDLSVAQAQEKVAQLLEFVGLFNYQGEEISQLFGGMRRRGILAWALINDPHLLILDEPTTGLDTQSQHVFWQKIKQLQAKGVAILLTSHYVEEISKLADELIMADFEHRRQ